MFTKEQQISMLQRAARASNMDGHIVATPPATMAERAMTWFGGKKNTPRKNSYLYCDSVDACFFYGPTDAPTVTFTARWVYGAKDLDRLSEAANLIRTMLHNMNVEAVLTNLATDGEGNKNRDD